MNNRALPVSMLFLVIVWFTSSCSSLKSRPTIVPTLPSPFEEKVDIGGYGLQILCTGQGTPTVIVESAFGEPGVETTSWKTVRNEVAKTTRICMYDRAGLGSSDVAPGENRTSKDMAQDLHRLLSNAHVPGPYILVGHSLGGYHVRVFAGQYPDEVVGLVLVDSSHPDQWSATHSVIPPEAPGEPFLFKQLRTIPPASLPEKMDVPSSIEQVRAVKSFGDLPLVVLSRSLTWRTPELPPEVGEKVEQIWQTLQNDLITLSSNSTHVTATTAGHFIQVDEPQLVIDAIRKVIAQAKNE